MSNIISGRARVVYISDEFVHLSKGGLDGKIVAFKDSWLAANYDLQDWVTFKAKSYEADPPHCNFGVRFKALPKSVKFESKAVMTEGIGTFFKVDEHQGQYGFIMTNDGHTVYFTASVVRPETQDIRTAFKTGVQVKYKAIEQKQNNCRWRAIAVCNKNATFESFSSRQPRPNESTANKQAGAGAVAAAAAAAANVTPMKKASQNTTTAAAIATAAKYAANGEAYPSAQASARAVSNSLSSNTASAQLNSNNKQINPSAVDSRSSSVSRSEGSSTVGSNRMTATPLLSSNAFPEPTSFADSGGTGDAYEDAVRRLAYFRHLVMIMSSKEDINKYKYHNFVMKQV